MIGAEELPPKPIKSALERNDHCWATFGREEVDLQRETVLHAVAGTHVQDVDGSHWEPPDFLPHVHNSNVSETRQSIALVHVYTRYISCVQHHSTDFGS